MESISLPSYDSNKHNLNNLHNKKTNFVKILKFDCNNKFEPEFISGTPPNHFIDLLKKRMEIYSCTHSVK
jgi:hypothetical protein